MRTLGITGGIGSGKSTVCRIFESLGARVFYADDEAKRLMHEHPAIRTELVEAFGRESYLDDGSLNRLHLADRVFHDEAALRRLNAIVHPRVFEAFEDARRRAEKDGAPLMIKEAAIMFESGGDAMVDAVAVVDAPVDVRIRRVVARDGTTEAAVRARMANQLPPEELRSRADFVIENHGSEDELREQVERVFRAVTANVEG